MVQSESLSYLLALGSVFSFSTAAIGFTYFSGRVSPLWMNIFKCGVALICCVPAVLWQTGSITFDFSTQWPFYVSGLIGLNIGDWMLLSAFKRMGPGRTLIVFGFQPFVVGSISYYIWNERLYPIQLLAILFFVFCLFLFSYERFKQARKWEILGLALALGGVFMDSLGVLLTRHAFNMNPMYTGLDAQLHRCLGAFISFTFFIPFIKIDFFKNLKKLSGKEKGIATLASFFGTFLSLAFYLQAVKVGKLATVTSIVLTDPVFSTALECLWLRVWPSRYLWLALLSFACAMACLFAPQWFGVGL